MRIRHRTIYNYNRAVFFDPHRLMLRPRDGLSVRVLDCAITTEPESLLSWSVDVRGNAVAMATFQEISDRLVIESDMNVDVTIPPWPEYNIARMATEYPFYYSDDDWLDLGALAKPYFTDPEGRLERWVRSFIAGRPTNTLALLSDLNSGIQLSLNYQSREYEGTQTPLETIDRGWGACRDFAILFAEAARILGFGVRVVSGYLHDPDMSNIASGATHAWAEVFIPGAGWVPFDPTNATIGGPNLVPVAVGRSMAQVVPVSGSFQGLTGSFMGMSVEVGFSQY